MQQMFYNSLWTLQIEKHGGSPGMGHRSLVFFPKKGGPNVCGTK